MQEITILAPDDWHLHFRDGDMLGETVPATARCFKRAIVMPNLVPPVTTAALAQAYESRILAAKQKATGRSASKATSGKPERNGKRQVFGRLAKRRGGCTGGASLT